MAAAAVSVACPLRRSTRLAHAHSNPPARTPHRLKHHPPRHPPRPAPDPDPDHDHDSSSDDPENELTPRALRALKRQRLALDPDGLPLVPRPRPKKRRKGLALPAKVCPPTGLATPGSSSRSKRPSSPPRLPLTPKRPQYTDGQALCCSTFFPTDSCHSPHSSATASTTSVPDPTKDPFGDLGLPGDENRPTCRQHALATTLRNEPSFSATDTQQTAAKPELSIPLPPVSAELSTAPASCSDPSKSPEPLTPLTPLTPSPESSPSLPGHDRQVLPLSPPHEPLPPPVSLEALPVASAPESSSSPAGALSQPQLTTDDAFPVPLPAPAISLDPALDTLIPFEGLHPPFDPELSVGMSSPPCQSAAPALQGIELQEPFHSFPAAHPLYVPPHPVFVRDREINIWKLACQERVDYLLRRYGVDYIKALVESQARSLAHSSSSSPTDSSTQTKFRLYTPASYTYSASSSSWGSTSVLRKTSPVDDDPDDPDAAWPMDDTDWVDADVDMEDDDEDDYDDDDDDVAEPEPEREGEATLEAVQGLVIADTTSDDPSTVDTAAMQVDDTLSKPESMQVDGPCPKATVSAAPPTVDPSSHPVTPAPHPYPSSPLPGTPPGLPPLSSLHVPLLSEPPRAFMGRGTPPDRRRLIEWSGSGRFATNGMGPPLYLTPVPQRHPSTHVGIVPVSVNQSPPIQPPPPQTPHTHGEWTSFLYSMLEGDGVGVGVGTSVGNVSHTSDAAWYELGLSSVPSIDPGDALDLPLSQPHAHGRSPAAEQPVEEGNSSSSTLRFALG